jgi:hypothetical protein
VYKQRDEETGDGERERERERRKTFRERESSRKPKRIMTRNAIPDKDTTRRTQREQKKKENTKEPHQHTPAHNNNRNERAAYLLRNESRMQRWIKLQLAEFSFFVFEILPLFH